MRGGDRPEYLDKQFELKSSNYLLMSGFAFTGRQNVIIISQVTNY